MDYKQVIGLGRNTTFDSLVVTWPDRTTSTYKGLAINKLHNIAQENGGKEAAESFTDKTLFQPLAPSVFDRHTEDDYVDFYYERNLPVMLSHQGPYVTRGDVNGDGLEDIYIGGAKGQPGQLYRQKADGTFYKKEQELFRQYQDVEDVAVLFFDADKDNDLDLFIGAGGNNAARGSKTIQHRLYVNNGKGDFSISTTALPGNDANIAVAAAYDFDGDGDEDLFVGGRSVPYVYGIMPRSYIYQNNGKGIFTDVTSSVNPVLARVGMVTSAAWADVTGDGKKELLIAGEWMTPKVFTWKSHRLEELKTTGFENLSGWWQSLAVADLNSDGRQDLILGNVGENFYLRPVNGQPVKLWVADFDNNGTMDQFLTQTINGKDMPVFLKKEVAEQFPALKKNNLRNSEYAKKSIQELFGEKVLADAARYIFNYTQSVVALNTGNGRFAVTPLPVRAQLSSINAVCATDVNGDGKTDLITGGNLFTFPPQFGRLDASYGDVFINNEKGRFTWMPNTTSGINLRGQVKSIQEVRGKKGKRFIITQNNEAPILYGLK
jgi:hypothetical protein